MKVVLIAIPGFHIIQNLSACIILIFVGFDLDLWNRLYQYPKSLPNRPIDKDARNKRVAFSKQLKRRGTSRGNSLHIGPVLCIVELILDQ